MQNSTRETLGYYDANAEKFVASTVGVEFGDFQQRFISMIPRGGRVLDLGCGSGRDSLAFLKAGFVVDAVDGSVEMAKMASELTGLPVMHALFAEFEPNGEYDGIWACSSLLHVPLADLAGVVSKYAAHLKSGGVFYMSFKLGAHEGMRNGRWFTDMTEESFHSLVDRVNGLGIASLDTTSDVRPDRADEKWLNAWCVKGA